MLCSAFGEVAKIAMFEKASGLQALVQFSDTKPAREAQQVRHAAAAAAAAAWWRLVHSCECARMAAT
jgi:hypothetical protein